MAQVPYTGVPSVAPQGPNTNLRETIPSSSADFGGMSAAATGALGRGVQDAGAGFMNAAIQTQELYNHIAVQDAYNKIEKQYFNLTYGDPDDPSKKGIYALQGADAMKAYKPTMDAMETVRSDLIAGLNNDAQRLAFESAARRLQYNTQATIGRHVDQQTRTWGVATESAGAVNANQNAAANPGDPANVASSAEEARKRYFRVAQLHLGGSLGDTPESVATNTQKVFRDADTSTVQSVIDGFLRMNNPAGALGFLNNGRLPPRVGADGKLLDPPDGVPVKQAIDPTHHQALYDRVQNIGAQVMGQQAAGNVFRRVAPGANTGPIADDSLPSEAKQFLPALSGGEGNYSSPAPKGDGSTTPIHNNRYQFLYSTWKDEAPKAGVDVNDRSPAAQDRVAWNYAKNVYAANNGGRDLQKDIAEGGHEGEIARALNRVWPSLPGGKEQNTDMPTWLQRMRAKQLPTTNDGPAPFTGAQIQQMTDDLDADPSLTDPKARNAARIDLERRIAIHDKAVHANQSAMMDDWGTKILRDPTSVNERDILNDPRGQFAQKNAIITELRNLLSGRGQGMGERFNELFARTNAENSNPDRIVSPAQIYPYLGRGLTFSGVKALEQHMMGRNSTDGETIKMSQQSVIKTAEQRINPKVGGRNPDMTGAENYDRFLGAAYRKAAELTKAGKMSPLEIWAEDGPIAELADTYASPLARQLGESARKAANTVGSNAASPGAGPGKSAPAPISQSTPALGVGKWYRNQGGTLVEVPEGAPGGRKLLAPDWRNQRSWGPKGESVTAPSAPSAP